MHMGTPIYQCTGLPGIPVGRGTLALRSMAPWAGEPLDRGPLPSLKACYPSPP